MGANAADWPAATECAILNWIVAERTKFTGEHDGQDDRVQAAGRPGRFRLPCRARRGGRCARHRGDPGMVGIERPDPGRGGQAGDRRLPGAGAGPLSRPGRTGRQRSPALDGRSRFRRRGRPGPARRGPVPQGDRQRQGRRDRLLHGWRAHLAGGGERARGGRLCRVVRFSAAGICRRGEDQGAADGALGAGGHRLSHREGRRAGEKARRRPRRGSSSIATRRSTPSPTRRRTRRSWIS